MHLGRIPHFVFRVTYSMFPTFTHQLHQLSLYQCVLIFVYFFCFLSYSRAVVLCFVSMHK